MDLNSFKFTKEHEWVKLEGDIATIGISDYAQKELGDVVYIDLPNPGDSLSKGDVCSNIESVKAVNDIYTPVSGEIVEVNSILEDSPETINQDPYNNGWILKIKISDNNNLNEMMDNITYEKYLKGQ